MMQALLVLFALAGGFIGTGKIAAWVAVKLFKQGDDIAGWMVAWRMTKERRAERRARPVSRTSRTLGLVLLFVFVMLIARRPGARHLTWVGFRGLLVALWHLLDVVLGRWKWALVGFVAWFVWRLRVERARYLRGEASTNVGEARAAYRHLVEHAAPDAFLNAGVASRTKQTPNVHGVEIARCVLPDGRSFEYGFRARVDLPAGLTPQLLRDKSSGGLDAQDDAIATAFSATMRDKMKGTDEGKVIRKAFPSERNRISVVGSIIEPIAGPFGTMRSETCGLTLLWRSPLSIVVPFPGPFPIRSTLDHVPVGLTTAGKYASVRIRGRHTSIQGMTNRLALGERIPTPNGMTTMGDVNVGDLVLGMDGRPTRVVEKSDPVRRPTFLVKFSTGDVIEADADHRWFVQSMKQVARERGGLGRTGQVLTTAELLNAGILNADEDRSRLRQLTFGEAEAIRSDRAAGGTVRELVASSGASRSTVYNVINGHVLTTDRPGRSKDPERRVIHGARWNVPVAVPYDPPPVDLPVDPYVVGHWLGDGTQRVSGRHANLTCHEDEADEIVAHYAAAGYAERRRRQYDTKAVQVTITDLHRDLRALGLEDGKRIPGTYLRASYAQRLALLQGYLDADGSHSPASDGHGSRVSVETSNEALAGDVREMVCSLGMKPGRVARNERERDGRTSVTWSFSFAPADRVFRLARKLEGFVPVGPQWRTIRSITPTGRSPLGACIAVDNADHVFLAGRGFVPTHNSGKTSLARCIAATVGGIHPVDQYPLAFVILDAKGRGGDLGALTPRAAFYSCEVTEIGYALEAIVDEGMRRYSLLTRGKGEWTDFTLAFPEIIVWMDETQFVANLDPSSVHPKPRFELDRRMEAMWSIVTRMRAVGIHLVVLAQLLKAKRIDTEITSQFANRMSTFQEGWDRARVAVPGSTATIGPHRLDRSMQGAAVGEFEGEGLPGQLHVMRAMYATPDQSLQYAEEQAARGCTVELPWLAPGVAARHERARAAADADNAEASREATISATGRDVTSDLDVWRKKSGSFLDAASMTPAARESVEWFEQASNSRSPFSENGVSTSRQLSRWARSAWGAVHRISGATEELRADAQAHLETIGAFTSAQGVESPTG